MLSGSWGGHGQQDAAEGGGGPQWMGRIESSFGGVGMVEPRVQWAESEWEVTKWDINSIQLFAELGEGRVRVA